MKKIICLLLFVSLYSVKSYALHGAGVTQDFATGQITDASGSFAHLGDSQIKLAFDYYTNTDTLTINDFYIEGILFDSYSWDLLTGLSVESDCVISGTACGVFSNILGLQNTNVSRIGGSLQYYFNDISGEGGDLFFIDSVIVDSDIFYDGAYAATISVSSVPLPGAVIFFISGFLLLAGFVRKKPV